MIDLTDTIIKLQIVTLLLIIAISLSVLAFGKLEKQKKEK